jgi:hypothetical protein
VIRLLQWRIWPLILMVSLGCAVAYGQGCEDFSLEAEASTPTVEPSKPFFIQLTLTNHSQGTVTVYAPDLPSGWSVYEKSGSRWAHVWGQAVNRGRGSAAALENSEPSKKFPPEKYVRLVPGGVLQREVDLTEAIWGPKQLAVRYRANILRLFFTYHYEAQGDEAQLNMLQCHMRTEPVEISLITKKQAGNKKAAAAANGSQ